MPAEARISSIWKKQKLFISLFFIAFGLYFFFDGAVGYPRKDERYLKHKEFVEAGNREGWTAYANERGWSQKPPEKFLGPGKYQEQFFFGGLTTIVGLALLGYWAAHKGRILRSDADAVYAAGKRVPFEAITGVGKKKWDTKGIAKVRYQMNGRRGEFVVDDYKFDTDPARQILQEIEAHLLARAAPTSDEPPGV